MTAAAGPAGSGGDRAERRDEFRRWVDQLAELVRACPEVAAPHPGRYGDLTTLGPGWRIPGIRVEDTELIVGVVGRYPATTAQIDRAVRRAVAGHGDERRVTVVIADLVGPDDTAAVEPHPVVPAAAPATTMRHTESIRPTGGLL